MARVRPGCPGALVLAGVLGLQFTQKSVLRQLTNGKLEGAGYWTDQPQILSAGMGFDNIIGLPELTEETVRAAGGSWYSGLICKNGDEPTTGDVSAVGLTGTLETVGRSTPRRRFRQAHTTPATT